MREENRANQNTESDTALSELKYKIKSDWERLMSNRNRISLKPMLACPECNATGKMDCHICNGTGKHHIQYDEKVTPCDFCSGTGKVTCTGCDGAKEVPNTYRTRIKWILIIGVIAWVILIFTVWKTNHDILPAQKAEIFGTGGGASRIPQNSQAPMNSPAVPHAGAGNTVYPPLTPQSQTVPGGVKAGP